MIQVHICKIRTGCWSIRRVGTVRVYTTGTYRYVMSIARRWKAARIYVWRDHKITLASPNTRVGIEVLP